MVNQSVFPENSGVVSCFPNVAVIHNAVCKYGGYVQ